MISDQPEYIGKFRIYERLGEGGMAVVYRSHQESMDRWVALKTFLPGQDVSPDVFRRFQAEAKTAGALRHTNIVQVYEASTNQPPYYIAFEYLPGGTLEDRLKTGPLPLEQALEIMDAVCKGIDYARGQNVVHRDVKPANIMFDADENPVLTDFGISKREDATSYTVSGHVFGTPLYMSPEQVKGQCVDYRSDLYSAAVVLHEMLVGSPPFNGGNPLTVMHQIVNDPPPRLADLGVNLPSGIDYVLQKAQSKDPDDRYQSGSDLMRALRQAVDPASSAIGQSYLGAVPAPAISSSAVGRHPHAVPVREPSSAAWTRRLIAASLGIVLVTIVGLLAHVIINRSIDRIVPPTNVDGPVINGPDADADYYATMEKTKNCKVTEQISEWRACYQRHPSDGRIVDQFTSLLYSEKRFVEFTEKAETFLNSQPTDGLSEIGWDRMQYVVYVKHNYALAIKECALKIKDPELKHTQLQTAIDMLDEILKMPGLPKQDENFIRASRDNIEAHLKKVGRQ